MTIEFLQRKGKARLAYRHTARGTALPTLVFLCGFRSDMTGAKAQYLGGLCEERGQSYLRFDYSGHGASGGKFEDGTIGQWLDDTLDVLDRLTQGPVLIAGSSMGGWLGLLAALARPDRICGLILLAAALDFTRAIEARLSPSQKARLAEQGFVTAPSDYAETPHIFTRDLLEDGARHCLLDAPIEIECPVRLVQGLRDSDVPWQTAERIEAALTSSDKKLYLLENGDHRLSSLGDLHLLGELVADLSGACI